MYLSGAKNDGCDDDVANYYDVVMFFSFFFPLFVVFAGGTLAEQVLYRITANEGIGCVWEWRAN